MQTSMCKSQERLYAIYNAMRGRCLNPKSKVYNRYGGRGITVCEEWLNDYYSFKQWAYSNGYDENAPRGKCTLDRIDNDGNYEPNNCRWVDMKVQNNNQHRAYTFTQKPDSGEKITNRMWTINGKTMNAKWWCKYYGTGYQFVLYRVNVMGMTPYEALTYPKRKSGRPRKKEVNKSAE